MQTEPPHEPVRLRVRSVSRALPMALLVAREAAMAGFRPVLRRFDLTEQQWRVLYVLGSMPEIEATSLAEATCLLAPSLSRILRDLEKRRLLVRQAAPGDRRRSLVAISGEGRQLIDAITPGIEEAYAGIVERFGRERMDKLQHLLRQLGETLESSVTENN